jgi:hypothetical protein
MTQERNDDGKEFDSKINTTSRWAANIANLSKIIHKRKRK